MAEDEIASAGGEATDEASDEALDVAHLAVLLRSEGIALPDGGLDALGRWAELLRDWNARMNLTRITDPREVAVQHLLDSLLGLRVLDDVSADAPLRAVDVGPGAGLPALPLAVARPAWSFTLVETSGKAASFLEAAVDAMGLANVEVRKARAEDAAREPALREAFDLATARAVAALPTLLEYGLPFLRVGGRMLAWKGAAADEEVRAAAEALNVLGGRVTRRWRYELPGLDQPRAILVVDKRRPTPARYPRQAGTPKRRPL